jgi:hypothetical protein
MIVTGPTGPNTDCGASLQLGWASPPKWARPAGQWVSSAVASPVRFRGRSRLRMASFILRGSVSTPEKPPGAGFQPSSAWVPGSQASPVVPGRPHRPALAISYSDTLAGTPPPNAPQMRLDVDYVPPRGTLRLSMYPQRWLSNKRGGGLSRRLIVRACFGVLLVCRGDFCHNELPNMNQLFREVS